jgi:hypothetical protein
VRARGAVAMGLAGLWDPLSVLLHQQDCMGLIPEGEHLAQSQTDPALCVLIADVCPYDSPDRCATMAIEIGLIQKWVKCLLLVGERCTADLMAIWS